MKKLYGARYSGKMMVGMIQINFGLAANRNAKALHATLFSKTAEGVNELYQKDYPHLITKIIPEGVLLTFPRCDL